MLSQLALRPSCFRKRRWFPLVFRFLTQAQHPGNIKTRLNVYVKFFPSSQELVVSA